MKRVLCLLLCLMLVPLSAFGENVEDSLIVGMISTRTTEIRPLTPQERDIVSLYGVVYESLVTVDDNGLPQPLLAESWTRAAGARLGPSPCARTSPFRTARRSPRRTW